MIMVKVDRRENPIFSKYSEKIVSDSLKMDFKKKCYLCEEVTRHYEVDHFYPQKYYPHLINNYLNLFYCCQKCNKIKPKKINIDSANEILDCCDTDIEKYIKLRLNLRECIIEIEQVESSLELDKKIKNTIALLHRIYNGKNSKSNSCEDLREDIIENINSFRKKLNRYRSTKLKRAIIEEIKEELYTASSYSTFKRWIIRDNQTLTKEFQKYIDEVG
jgi:hypothetical protein